MSRIWFSGSRNPNKVQLLMSGYHVTLERLFGQGHMTEMVDQNYFKMYINDTEVISSVQDCGILGQGIQIKYNY